MSGHHTRDALLRHRRLGPAGQPAALHAARAQGAEGIELVATFYAPGTSRRSRARSRASGAARRSSASTRRRAAGSACSARTRPRAPRSGCPTGATSACGCATPCSSAAACRCTRCRAPSDAVPDWMAVGFDLFAGALAARPLRPRAGRRRAPGRRRERGAPLRPRLRDLPGRDLLRAARPPPAAEAHAVGRPAADRGAQAQGHLRRRRRALAPHARRDRRLRRGLRRLRAGASGSGTWVGDPAEGVMVIPTAPPARALREAAARRRAPALA